MEIEWTKSGRSSLVNVLGYIEEEFGTNSARNVYERIFHKVSLLQVNPEMGKLLSFSREKRLRYLLVHKYCKIFYRSDLQEKIYVLLVWDVR